MIVIQASPSPTASRLRRPDFPQGAPLLSNRSVTDIEAELLPRAWAGHVKLLVERQCLDGGSSDGGFDSGGTGWCDGRHAAYSLAILIANVGRHWDVLTEEDSRQVIARTCRFLLRRQHADGRLDLDGSYTPNEVGFTLPGLAAGYRYLDSRNEVGTWSEVLGFLEIFLKRGAEAVLAGSAFTANHRWAAACAPLAAVHQLWPDARYLAKIESYLADGVDCDADGCWFEERSPNYNTVANHGLYVIADCLGRPEFERIVERNGDFMLHMIQPNGEADSSFSHRQDRGCANRSVLDYPILRRLAQTTGKGAYIPLLLDHLKNRSKSIPASGLVPLLYWIDKNPGHLPAPEPIPEDYDIRFLQNHALRVRRSTRALTLTADSGGHFFTDVRDQWGGIKRSDEWFHLQAEGVVIASIQLGAYGLAMFQPETLDVNRSGASLCSVRDGWEHTLHFRPGAPHLHMPWDWTTSVEAEWSKDLSRVHLHFRSSTEHSLVSVLKILVRPEATLQEGNAAIQSLSARQSVWLDGASPVLLRPPAGAGGRGLKISGLPAGQHKQDHGFPPSIPSAVPATCAGLLLGLCFPIDFRMEIEVRI